LEEAPLFASAQAGAKSAGLQFGICSYYGDIALECGTEFNVVARWFASLTAQEFQRLPWCLSLDAAGAAPELLMNRPLGETVDLLWAPIYAFLLFQTSLARLLQTPNALW
jgi:hypothetical protein